MSAAPATAPFPPQTRTTPRHRGRGERGGEHGVALGLFERWELRGGGELEAGVGCARPEAVVERGGAHVGVVREEGRVIPTLCQDTVLRMPPPASAEAEEALMREVGRKVADGYYVANPPPHLAPR